MDKAYKTRAEYDVRILCIDSGIQACPVVAVVDVHGTKAVMIYPADGQLSIGYTNPYDLVEVTINVEEREEV
jgi:hypothetical protein